MLRILGCAAGAIAVLVLAGVPAFGRGRPYPDLSGPPLRLDGTIEAVVTFDRPIGQAAVSAVGRVFVTFHPGSHPAPSFL